MTLITRINVDQKIKYGSSQIPAFHTLLFLFLYAYLSPLHAGDIGTLSSKELVKKLQEGGHVLYIRHAATDHSSQDKNLSDFSKCEMQRNLSLQGRKQSRILGDATKALNIKIDNVYASPYCRCVDTAEIAFGRSQIVDGLKSSSAINQKNSTRAADGLRKRLSEIPKQGYNTVLVGHTANLREATNIWPKPEGVVYIFKPLGTEGHQLLGRITPEEWESLAGNN